MTPVRMALTGLLLAAGAWIGCAANVGKEEQASPPAPSRKNNAMDEKATFAAGCFWGVEDAFRKVKGVTNVTAGYTGGHTAHPTYEQVCRHTTGHAEAVEVEYDPAQVTYEQLLEVLWRIHNPTTLNRQGPDVGDQYRSAIFYHTPAQQAAAEASKARLERSRRYAKPVVTEITPAATFYRAEEYHQRYHEKQGGGQCPIDIGQTLEPGPAPLSNEELKRRLTAEQYHVMREGGTERPFANAYWNNKSPGLYVDPITGEALFASTDKFDSRTGWPSFTRPIQADAVVEQADKKHGMVRTEVRAKQSGSHLGHVFDDGPDPTGLRYCINSAALRFIPVEDLEKEGYGQYRSLLTPSTPSSGSRR